jgi:hypothetical protein
MLQSFHYIAFSIMKMINLSAPITELRAETYHYGEVMFGEAGLNPELARRFAIYFERIATVEPKPQEILEPNLGEYFAMLALQQVLTETPLPTNAPVQVTAYTYVKDEQFIGFTLSNAFGTNYSPKTFFSPGLNRYTANLLLSDEKTTYPSTPQ